ncbi:hypothetical protein ANCDUO_07597 [Ancylostoma duodenale]|uniref:Uncharacterized protein n=1 Tax=Ancylostoma duodenale TaxID=51022 RepID=A0A0C2GYA1_9BILA|nr:hypothetical protein ANCDUO_07597 [Ancylostoma duodenale]
MYSFKIEDRRQIGKPEGDRVNEAGISSILFAIKLLKTDLNSDNSLLSIRIDQYSGVLLRFTNLATILNLLCITLNEYIFICYPLRYSALITR